VEQSLKIAPIIALKVPQTIDIRELKASCKNLKCLTILHYQNIKHFKPMLNQATVYFIEKRRGFLMENIEI